MTDVEGQEHYDNFFEEVFVELNDKVCQIKLQISVAACLTFLKLIKNLKPRKFE